MKKGNSYFYVGPKEIFKRVDQQFEGHVIGKTVDILEWIQKTDQKIIHEELIATFIINLNEELVIADRHSEHVLCAGGKNVLSAGEITFNFETQEISVSEITNQSTGYCPEPKSWEYVEMALNKIDIESPNYFTRAFEFRYCEHCQNKNLIKEDIYECTFCGSELDRTWNIYKMQDIL